MTDKKHGFEDLPGDEDTISGGRLIKIGDLEAVQELWSWDGWYGESVIFKKKDVEEMTDPELVKLIKGTGRFAKVPESEFCVSRDEEKFVFVNVSLDEDD